MTKKDKKHLDFDLGFLDNVKTEKPKQKPTETDDKVSTTVRHNEPVSNSSSRQSSGGAGSCFGRIGSYIIVIVIIAVIRVAFESIFPGTSSETPSTCDAAKLESLNPPDSEKNNVESLESRLSSTYVNNYSQASVDNYNSLLAQYNIEKNSYNSKVDAYNQYLNSNCKK